jgi:hypothetical protein
MHITLRDFEIKKAEFEREGSVVGGVFDVNMLDVDRGSCNSPLVSFAQRGVRQGLAGHYMNSGITHRCVRYELVWEVALFMIILTSAGRAIGLP